METLLHKFYEASISIGRDGSMLVASTDDRILAWALLLCVILVICVMARLLWRNRFGGRLTATMLVLTLLMTALILPSIKHEYIHVSRQALTIESGNWLMPSRQIIDMEDIRNIRESDPLGVLPSNLMGDPVIDWNLTRNNGKQESIRLNDFFSAHRMVVAYYYKDRGYWLERLEDRNRVD